MTANFISLDPNKHRSDELTSKAAEWQDSMSRENEEAHQIDSYLNGHYADYPDYPQDSDSQDRPENKTPYTESDIEHYKRILANKVRDINQRSRNEKNGYIDSHGYEPTIDDGDILPSEKLELIASHGIRRYGWLGELSPEEAYKKKYMYIVREIGLADSDESRHQVRDRYGRVGKKPYDDVINRIDSAWELATEDGKSLYLGLDFSVNDNRGKHRTLKKLSNSPKAALKKDRNVIDKIIRSTNAEQKLPFGCSSINFGYTELESAAINPRTSIRIVPRYAIAINSHDATYAYNLVHSGKSLDPATSAAMQFKILSQIHEQNRLYLPIIGRTAIPQDHDSESAMPMTEEEKRTLAMIEEIDKIVTMKLMSCMENLYEYGLKEQIDSETPEQHTNTLTKQQEIRQAKIKARNRRIRALVNQLKTRAPKEQYQYLYQWLRDGSISLVLKSNDNIIGRDNAYNEHIEALAKLQEAFHSPENREAVTSLYGLKSRRRLPFNINRNENGDELKLTPKH